jgi:hypothetical protein
VQADDEDIAAWANAIALWMQQQKLERVGFMELLDRVDYPVVKGWLCCWMKGLQWIALRVANFIGVLGSWWR